MKINYFYELDYGLEEKLTDIFKTDKEQVIELFTKNNLYKQQENKLEYVGIIAYKDIVIAVLPKFLKRFHLGREKENEILKLTIEAIKKHKNENMISTESNEIDNGNIFALIDYFFKDYINNGLYKTFIEKLDYNGEGEIDWEETIQKEDSYLINGNPVYLNFWTEDSDNDEKDFIQKIHKYILNKCKLYLKNSEIQKTLNLIQIPYFDFPVNEDIGTKDYILTQINNRLNLEFNEHKIILLKKMKIFINEIYSDSNNGLELWGINKFWSVWEECCKGILKDQKEQYSNIIKPVWSNLEEQIKIEKETLRPDVLRKEEDRLYIFDAKYYDFYFDVNGRLVGEVPGISSVIKQYCYELALKDSATSIENYFVIPTLEETKVIGKVEFKIFDLQSIKTLQLNYEVCFNMYLKNHYYNIKELKNILCS